MAEDKLDTLIKLVDAEARNVNRQAAVFLKGLLARPNQIEGFAEYVADGDPTERQALEAWIEDWLPGGTESQWVPAWRNAAL